MSLSLETHTGHKLTSKEAKFITEYIKTGNGQQSAISAGYAEKFARSTAQGLMRKDYIAEEIQYQTKEIMKSNIATAEEVMDYFTKVMKGEIKDQFGLEASLGERTKAAQELAKRLIDIPNKLEGNKMPEVKISLDWGQSEVENPTVRVAYGLSEVSEIDEPTPNEE